MISFKQFMSESINDKGLFKALFVIGLPGAGKSYTVSRLKGTVSPVVVNTDKAAEYMGKKLRVPVNSDTWHMFDEKVSRMTKSMLSNYADGMLPMFVDGTSNDVSNILNRMGMLESLGYDIGVVFVHASLATAKKRALERAKTTGRSVDESFIEKVDKLNRDNASFLKSKVGFFKEVMNDTDALDDEEMQEAFTKTQGFFNAPLMNPVGKRNIEKLKEEKAKYLVPTIFSKEELNKKIESWYR